MPLRTRIFVFISATVLIVLGISILLMVINKKTKQSETATTTVSTVSSVGDNNGLVSDGSGYITDTSGLLSGQAGQKLAVQVPTTEEVEKNSVRQLAKIFIERYGSYSSDNDYQNIKEVKSLCASSLWSELSGKMTGVKSNDFTGVTTKVISSKITSWSSSAAIVSLETMKTEDSNGTVKNTQQSATVYLSYVSGQWLVNKFEWK